jgi:hemolysin activation/secretion protein
MHLRLTRLETWVAIGILSGSPVASTLAAPATPPPGLAPTLDPGAVLKQQLQNQKNYVPEPAPGQRLPGPVLEIPPQPETTLQAAPGLRFVLRGITIDQSAFLSPEELAALYQRSIGREIGFDDLQNIIEQINATYRAKGVATAVAVLPPQRIENGIVHIQLVEGRVGKVDIEGAQLTRRSYIEERLGTAPDQIINAEALERALVYFNRTNQTQLQASLQPGGSLGLTDILLRTTEPPHYDVQGFVDNLSIKSIGRYEGGIYLRDNEPLHIGDRLDLYIVGAQGSVSGNGLYSIPINLSGGQLGLSYARGNTNVNQGNPGAPLDITGHSSTIGINFVQPLFVDEQWKIDGALYFSRDQSTSTIAGSAFSDNFTNKPAIGARVEQVTPSRYILLTQTIADEQSHGIPGLSWAIVNNGTLTAIEQLPEPLTLVSLSLKSGWQLSNHSPLAPAELLQIGGFNTVRGYQQALLSGSSGFYVQFEVHHPLSPEFDAYGFFDAGAVFNSETGSRLARGSGLGASWNWRFLTLAAAASYGFDRKRLAPQDSPFQIYFRAAAHYAF